MYGCLKDCLILIPFRLPQISCFTCSLECFCSDSDSCSYVGIGPLLKFPHHWGQVQSYLTLLLIPLVPSSYQVLCDSLYSFPLVRYSCVLSAGILRALLCLKVYSWYIIERDVFHVHLLLCHLGLTSIKWFLQPSFSSQIFVLDLAQNFLADFSTSYKQHKGNNIRKAIRTDSSFGVIILSPDAVAAAKSLQSCPTLCDPIDGSLPGSPVPGIFQARTMEWVAISFSNAGKWKVKSLGRKKYNYIVKIYLQSAIEIFSQVERSIYLWGCL